MNRPLRRRLLWSGLAGLWLAGLVTAAATWLVAGDVIPLLLPQRIITFIMVLILGGISVAEIPLMILAMRRIAAEPLHHHLLILGLNSVYVFFAAVYALPVLLLSGNLVWGWLLCSLGLARLATSVLLVPTRDDLAPRGHATQDAAHQPQSGRGVGESPEGGP